MPEIGERAPDFTLPCIAPSGQAGTLALAALRPQPVVLYFYPRDATSSCTREAQDFSRLAPEFAALGAQVVGVSKDSLAAHRRFVQKQGLQVMLVSDEGTDLCERFGAWGPKRLYGKSYEGILRMTFLIGGDGRIAAIWRVAKVAGHAEAVLAALQGAEN